MNMDDIKITVLSDGTLKCETNQIGQANHLSAEQFLKEMARLAGGSTSTLKKKASHGHTHSHAHQGGHSH